MGIKGHFSSKSAKIKKAEDDPDFKDTNKKLKKRLALLQKPLSDMAEGKDPDISALEWEKAFGDDSSD